MKQTITIVDRGRGMQLSTSRVTVQDLVPYFQEGCTYEDIARWIPSLAREEVDVVEAYYRDNKAELDEQDRRIRERSVTRRNPPWVQKALEAGKARMAALRDELAHSRSNGDTK